MNIKAPDPSTVHKFPEPSPAATGKRKLAELAAARMLAGVAGVSVPPASAVTKLSSLDVDGPPTPPPPTTEASLDLSQAPPPPFDQPSKPKGFALQIVNPESLGISPTRPKSGDSPVTPWEGQLEELVKSKGGPSSSSEEPQLPDLGLHPVCGPSTGYGRSSVHRMVCNIDVEGLRRELDVIANQSEGVLSGRDECGFAPLHSACAMRLARADDNETPSELVRLLLASGSDPMGRDKDENTPLHWAARSGDVLSASSLLMKNATIDARNKQDETPLHWALRAGERSWDVVALLLENGARVGLLSRAYRRPIDLAAEGFVDDEGSLASFKSRNSLQGRHSSNALKKLLKMTRHDVVDSRANMLVRSPNSRTLVLHHPECNEHHPKSNTDWEAPDRVISIMGRVLPSQNEAGERMCSGVFPHEVTVSTDFERAKLDLLSRVHSAEYLSFVNDLSKDLEKQLKESGKMDDSDTGFAFPPPSVPFTPLVQRSMIKVSESSIKLGANSDTSFSAGSLRAARRAAGAVQHAVDWYVPHTMWNRSYPQMMSLTRIPVY